MIHLLVSILVFVINTVYRDRAYPRFYVLETVARVPYFSYLSVLHLYCLMNSNRIALPKNVVRLN